MKFISKSLYKATIVLLLSMNAYADCSYELFSINSTKDTRIIDFVEQLSDECSFSIIVTDPHAEQFLNTKLNKTNLKNFTIDEVLNIILTENNLSYTLENNILKISYLTTQMFQVDYILSQRESTGNTNVTLSSTQQSTSGVTNGGAANGAQSGGGSASEAGIQIQSSDKVEFWENLDKEFQNVLNRPQDLYVAEAPIINKNAGIVTVTATTKQMKRFKKYLKKLKDKVKLQVLIDVQLLTVTMNKGSSTGVDWSQLYALQNIALNANAILSDGVSAFTAATTPGAITTTTKNQSSLVSLTSSSTLTEVIKFLKTQGDVHSISNPKVLTLNNQPALITAGTEYFYKIKSSSTLAGGNTGATTQNEEIQSVFAGVLLTITPEISDDNMITLKINPSLSETTTNIASVDNSQRVMPPDLDRRQLSSVVTVKDGKRVILGGLINTKNTTSSNQVPILGDIPLLGYAFKYEETSQIVQELVIVIEPHIIHKNKKSLSLSQLGYSSIDDTDLEQNRSISK